MGDGRRLWVNQPGFRFWFCHQLFDIGKVFSSSVSLIEGQPHLRHKKVRSPSEVSSRVAGAR